MAAVLKSYPLEGTPFRGLILQGPLSLCAYIGVPNDHWLANIDDINFVCHRAITYQGEGDGELRPLGFYWYGWDYGHSGDRLTFGEDDQEFRRLLESLPEESRQILLRITDGDPDTPAKSWTVEEVEQDLVNAAVDLMEQMRHAAENFARVNFT